MSVMTDGTLPKLYGVAEMCEVFGICKATLFRWSRSGKLPPPVKLGNRMYWKPEAVEELFTNAERA